MRGQRWMAAIVGLAVMVLVAGCIQTVEDRNKNIRISGTRCVSGCGDVKVVVSGVYVSAVQQFDRTQHRSGDTLYTQWKELPGEHDVSLKVARKMRDCGFANVSCEASDPAEYYVVGYISQDRGAEMDGEAIGWTTWSLVMLVPAVFAPVPIMIPEDGNMVVSVYDANKKLVDTRRIFYRWRVYAFSIWGLMGKDSRVAAAANVAGGLIEKHRQKLH